MADIDLDERGVVYVERESGSVKPVLLGLLLGLGLGLLFAPQSGEQTRRGLNRRLRKFRALAEETVDELSERFTGSHRVARGRNEEPEVEEPEESVERETSVRDDLERRLSAARARRRAAAEDEEQHA
ncbi:MAG TPA: YtxH domain-containing protein [Gemmatimonadales bacterium]|nr:YtxH domain-containing protein [Gemmatimonadales bacterium]